MPDTIDGIPFWLLKVTVLLLGAAFGSFANVVIYRVPLGLSIVRPASRCPACSKAIRWYDNVPVLGWVMLGGKCRDCRAPISIRYPLVELSMAVLSLACLYLAVMRSGGLADVPGLALLWVFPFAFCFLLVALTFVDLEHWRIPHVFTLVGTALGVAAAFLTPTFTDVGWKESLLGMALGALPIAALIEVYFRLTRREGMGYGDVLLLGMIGATLGLQSLPFIFLASSIQGLLVAVPMVLVARHSPTPPWEAEEAAQASAAATTAEPSGESQPAPTDEPREYEPRTSGLRHAAVPFGPFLSLAAMEWLFFGDLLKGWFLP
jgi:leader peptidase (prepilin peptidase)/N-methyltransferase